MKVNISYAVDLEDVPVEVGKLLENAGYYMAVIMNELEEVGTANPTKSIESISSIREGLRNLDLRLSDCSNILSGYVDLQNKSPEETVVLEEGQDEPSI